MRVARGDTLPASAVVLRRFDPTDPSRCTLDEAGKPARLKSSAFKFDPWPEEGPIRRECSVYHEAGLIAIGLGVADCVESGRPEWRVAGASVRDVKRFTRSHVPDPNPFEVVEDPFPGGCPPPHPRDAAHSSIIHDLPLPGADKWYRDLALTFYVREGNPEFIDVSAR